LETLTFKPENLPDPIVIRSMQLEDLEQVQALDQMSFSLPWPASAFRYELVENLSSRLWVAETGGQTPRVVGMIVIWQILDEAHIASIAVHPDFRKLGIGARILSVGLIDAIRAGSILATLEVRAHNTAAQALYHRFRFEEVGRRPRYYKDNQEDALLMTVVFERAGSQGESYLEWLERGRWQET